MAKSKGFTLVEILIVIAILGILAAVVIPNVIGLMTRSAEMDKDLPGQKELRIEKDNTYSKLTLQRKMAEGERDGKQEEQLHSPLAH